MRTILSTILAALVCVAYLLHSNLPDSKPNPHNIVWKELPLDATAADRITNTFSRTTVGTALALAPATIEDYFVYQRVVYNLPGDKDLVLVSVPFSPRWAIQKGS